MLNRDYCEQFRLLLSEDNFFTVLILYALKSICLFSFFLSSYSLIFYFSSHFILLNWLIRSAAGFSTQVLMNTIKKTYCLGRQAKVDIPKFLLSKLSVIPDTCPLTLSPCATLNLWVSTNLICRNQSLDSTGLVGPGIVWSANNAKSIRLSSI